MLHKVIDNNKRVACEVCGENALWYDNEEFYMEFNGKMVNIGSGKGLVYATCDICKKIVCGSVNLRPFYARRISTEVSRCNLPGLYKNSSCCLQESLRIDDMGNVKLSQCCRDEYCIKSITEDEIQERKQINKYGKNR